MVVVGGGQTVVAEGGVEGNCLFVDVVYLLFSANATHTALI